MRRLLQHRQPFEDALDIGLPVAPAALCHRAHFQILHHGQRWEDLAALGNMGDAEMGALRRRHREQIDAVE
ncbi:hypothetical protein ACVWZZ_006854 [Bradyrhizobium sp. LM6.10]